MQFVSSQKGVAGGGGRIFKAFENFNMNIIIINEGDRSCML